MQTRPQIGVLLSLGVRIFISWSGERSGRVASALQQWIPRVIQAVRPWISSGSIEPGARWSIEIGQALEENQFGVLCLTPENLTAPWILFEAGALSKAVSQARVIPYLLNFDPRELQGPLGQFQAIQADRVGTLQLLSLLNAASADRAISAEALAETFDLWWPRLEATLHDVASTKPVEDAAPARSSEDMLGEVLSLLRTQRLPAPTPAPPPEPEPALATALPFEPALTLGARVRTLRASRGWNQSELAMVANVSQAYISGIETGRYYPKPWVLQAVAGAFGLSPEELTAKDPSSTA